MPLGTPDKAKQTNSCTEKWTTRNRLTEIKRTNKRTDSRTNSAILDRKATCKWQLPDGSDVRGNERAEAIFGRKQFPNGYLHLPGTSAQLSLLTLRHIVLPLIALRRWGPWPEPQGANERANTNHITERAHGQSSFKIPRRQRQTIQHVSVMARSARCLSQVKAHSTISASSVKYTDRSGRVNGK